MMIRIIHKPTAYSEKMGNLHRGHLFKDRWKITLIDHKHGTGRKANITSENHVR